MIKTLTVIVTGLETGTCENKYNLITYNNFIFITHIIYFPTYKLESYIPYNKSGMQLNT